MKKNITIFTVILFLAIMPSLFASKWGVSFNSCFFFPKSAFLQKEYGSQWMNYQLQVSYLTCPHLSVWAALDYSAKDKLQIVPLSLGASYYWKLSRCLFWTVGGGGSYTYAKVSHLEANKRSFNKKGLGALFKTSLEYRYSSKLFFSFFVDYFYQHFHFYSHRSSCVLLAEEIEKKKNLLNVGGTKIGLGIGTFF